MALETSPDEPIPVEKASRMVQAWIERLGAIWVEGQIAQLRKRRSTAWITLRDADQEVSIPVFANISQLTADSGEIAEGDRVVVLAKPGYFRKQGQLQWRASEFRAVGIGDLLARIEELKKLLAAEGLFAPERKQALPFLPHRIGLISGRGSAARRDVEQNAWRRWPQAQFEVREVAVQGPKSAIEVTQAVTELASIAEVDVIVIARGGGSMEDLLPFSNETLLRAVSQCPTPVISAIGHEEDTPLLDFVADLRASTPTDAAKRVVPDMAAEGQALAKLRERLDRTLRRRLDQERQALAQLASRPVMAEPAAVVHKQREHVRGQHDRARRAFTHALHRERADMMALERRRRAASPGHTLTSQSELLATLIGRCRQSLRTELQLESERIAASLARVQSMSPQSTLDRGYAVVRLADGTILRDADQAPVSAALDTRLARGSVQSVVIGHESAYQEEDPQTLFSDLLTPDSAGGAGPDKTGHDPPDRPQDR